MRALVRETRLSARALISPIFVVPGSGRRQPLEALSGFRQRHLAGGSLEQPGAHGVLELGDPLGGNGGHQVQLACRFREPAIPGDCEEGAKIRHGVHTCLETRILMSQYPRSVRDSQSIQSGA